MYRHFCFGHLTRAEAVRLETITDSEVEARKLAAIHLESIGRPPSALVWLRPAIAARSINYPDILAEYAPGATAAYRDRPFPAVFRADFREATPLTTVCKPIEQGQPWR